MEISEIAKRSDVSTRTIDCYANYGLLPAERPKANFRLCPASALPTLGRIQLLKSSPCSCGNQRYL